MHSPLKIKLTDLNPHLTCIICNGYFVNATTITECLHSFCRSCIVKYLETNKYCPICEVQIHKTKPLLNLRSDQTLQDIVYKLVPGLFQNEMQRRKEFYASHPNVTKPADPELSGELSERSYIYTSDDYISLSLEYYNNNNESSSTNNQSRRYLRCPAAVSILHLQKLIRAKYGLTPNHKVDILYQNDALCEDFTLIDVAYKYLWKRKGPLHLTYRIFETECRKKIKLNTDHHTKPVKDVQDAQTDEKPASPQLQPQPQLQPSSPAPQSQPSPPPKMDVDTEKPVENSQQQINSAATCEPTDTVNDKNTQPLSLSDQCSIINVNNNLNNNTVKSDKHLDEVVICDATSEVLPNFAPDKEVQLQISETGIISITTSIASSDITQTVTVTTPCPPLSSPSVIPPVSSAVESATPITAPSVVTCITCLTVTHPTSTTLTTLTTPSTVIPNMLRLSTSNKKSDLKSVRKINTNVSKSATTSVTTASKITNTTTTTAAAATINTTTTAITSTSTSTTNSGVLVESQNSEQRKRKLSAESAEANGNTLKKSANQVPFNVNNLSSTPSTVANITTTTTSSSSSESQLPLLKPSKLIVTSSLTSSKPPISPIFTSNTHHTLKTTTVIPSTHPTVTAVYQTSSVTPLPVQSPILKQNVPTSKLDKTMLQPSKMSNVSATVPKRTQSAGYKTLRTPPKIWNPQLPPRTHSYPYGYQSPISNMEQKLKASVSGTNVTSAPNSSNTVPSVPVPATKPKPNKFFKRNNIPRYLGNPASGVKPMYQISVPNTSPNTITSSATPATSNQNIKKSVASTANNAANIVKTTHASKESQNNITSKTTTASNKKSKPEDHHAPASNESDEKKKTEESENSKKDCEEQSRKSDIDKTPASESKASETKPSETINSTSEPKTSTTENSTFKTTEANANKTETTPVSTLTSKTFQQPRNSAKMSLSSRNIQTSVSEMLQLRNSPKASSASQIPKSTESQKENATEPQPECDNSINVAQDTETTETQTKTKEKDTEKKDVDEKSSENKNSSEDKSVDKEKSTKESSEEAAIDKDKQPPSTVSNSETEKSNELKISQTTVPIYSPRLKPKNDSKFQKSIASNLRIDVPNTDILENNPGSSKLTFSPQMSPLLDRNSPKPDKNSPKATSKIVPSSPKIDRDSSKNLLSGPKSPKNITKTTPALQISPMYDHMTAKSKAQLSPQLDRMSPKGHAKINQMFKMSPTASKSNLQMNLNYDNVNAKITPKGSPSSGDNPQKTGTSKSPTKTLSTCKTDLNVPSQKFNFMPPNPFIPNLSSPNLNPNQFLFPNYAAMSSYDPRLLSPHNLGGINNSLAYHNLPLSLSAISLANHNLPLSFSSMLYNQHHRLAYPGPTMPVNSTLSPTTPISTIASVTTSTATSSNSTTTSAAIVDPAKSSDSNKTVKPKDKNTNSAATMDKK